MDWRSECIWGICTYIWGGLTNLPNFPTPEFLSNLEDKTLMVVGNGFCQTPSFSSKSFAAWQFPDFAVGGQLWAGSAVEKHKLLNLCGMSTVQKSSNKNFQEKTECGRL